MSTTTLVLSSGLTVATGLAFAYVGKLVRGREVHMDDRLAVRLFSVWWFGAAAVLGLAASHTLLWLVGITDLGVHRVLQYAIAGPLALALWGLSYYLFYLFTGRRGLIWPITLVYLGYLAFSFYYFFTLRPVGLTTTDWNVQLTPSVTDRAGMDLLFGALTAAPVLLGCLAYGSLGFRVREPQPRFRIFAVATGFVGLFGILLVGYVLGWQSRAWFPLVYEVPALVASLLIVIAYRPPGWLLRRWESMPRRESSST